MAIYGTVVSVEIDVDVKSQAGSMYKGYRIAYRSEDGKIYELAKTMQSLKYTPTVLEALKQLQPGDEFTAVTEKNAKGFLDVKSLSKGRVSGGELPDQAPSAAKAASSPAPVRTGNTYETPEERAVKQRLIVRQSSIAQAIILHATNDLDSVFEAADSIEQWVYRGL